MPDPTDSTLPPVAMDRPSPNGLEINRADGELYRRRKSALEDALERGSGAQLQEWINGNMSRLVEQPSCSTLPRP